MIGPQILIVEDDLELQLIYAAMLEECECRLSQVYDGLKALEALEENNFDLIILDIILDEMSGDVLFREIKQMPRYQDVPIVIVSVLAAERCQDLLEMDPGAAFLRKPFTKEDLLTIVNQRLALRA